MGVLNASIDGGLGHLEINRPEVRNAINRELLDALHETLDAWRERDEVRAVVVSGAGGKAFASGADIAELKARTHREAFFGLNQALFQKLEDFPRPTLAAIDGFALGGGLELALACDLRVASRAAKLGLPEVSLGLFPGAGGTWRLPRVVGLGRAKELVFTGRLIGADEAFALGLVERLVDDDARAAAFALAREIAQHSPLAVQVAKVSLNAHARPAAPDGLDRLAQGLLFDSPDKHARMAAFLEKRRK
ncbi:MAG: enoyl-CoA hydratase/isomerase family protein [Myxococcaceae bacterium]|nr:enoyl-CoA hydratase/isomerase family protein [Myxococcaceae bacterium]MCA3011123.1 enoyl-CoA hydratase/isomerase family protein [Myxococcaceae bacterium]